MLLSQDEDSGLFSTEELRVYFNDETLDSLMKLKKGDYVTLLCTAQDDLNNYLDGKQSEYKDAWKMGENAFYAFASGMPQSNEMKSIANAVNNIYLSLGDLT